VCLSGINAIATADQLIRSGECEVVVAGGMESMTNAPHLLEKSREGYKYGTVKMRDHMDYDALWDVYTDQGMGNLTESANTATASSPARSRTPSPHAATSWPPRRGRTACSTTRSCRC
jgi:acetyl-CoA C-acetyltransferase